MSPLYAWAIAEAIPFDAIRRLEQRLGTFPPPEPGTPGRSEASVQAAVRVRLSQLGGVAWRNNVGAGYMKDGTFLRFGLANDSAKMNELVKSSDLIGGRPVLIGPEHIGQTLCRLWAREIKKGDWSYSGTPRERAQLKFIELVNAMGGDAAFCNDEGQIV